MRMYKGWLIEKTFPSGMWEGTNYSDGYSPLKADTLQGLMAFIRDTMKGRA